MNRLNNTRHLYKSIVIISFLVFSIYCLTCFTYRKSRRKISTYVDINIPRFDSNIKQTKKQIFVQTLVHNKTSITRKVLLEEFSYDYEELPIKQIISRPVYQYDIEQIYFTFTTNTGRIRETIHQVKFWATRLGIRCLIIFESKDLQSKNYIKRYLKNEGISCKIKTSNVTRYEERYLELIQQAWYSLNKSSYTNMKTIQWFAFGDDDTIWFLNTLLQLLEYYNASNSIYLGNISDKLGAIQYHGTYYAYGGGGFILSRPLASRAAQHTKDCQRFTKMFGGDEMIGKCITEVLKINLTRNKNFHQMDHDGDMDGYLESGLEGLVSLHHIFSFWESFPEEHTNSPRETMYLLKLAYQTFGNHFLKRYVRLDHRTNRTFLLTMGYSFSLFNRILTYDELMKVEKTWRCCSEFVDRETRPKEKNKMTWYFRDVTNESANIVNGYGAVYENKQKDAIVQIPRIEIILTN
ncbi:unnamed protein product [Rotaria sp. Silwood1]|nr:unnamed protein product [Rotaria sp. Silwood1]CAF3740261.1 unnamed protein product [Rotaria sp. Silwood1]CAF3835829.1 unnamed protein product [Rotaria sp. Silwood1]CAF4977966.1 unnamed protein product [Rotaria sp. Silwood1]CAF4991063.1 unnamed protein product [Rotaria sp. Silwood1]